MVDLEEEEEGWEVAGLAAEVEGLDLELELDLEVRVAAPVIDCVRVLPTFDVDLEEGCLGATEEDAVEGRAGSV